MPNIPEKCLRCGAPISWEEGASVIKCEYCSYKNNLKDDFRSFFKNYLKLRDPKKIIKNPISLVFLLPIIFLSILINSPTKKQESIKAEYWPTNWNQFKKSKYFDVRTKSLAKKYRDPSIWDEVTKDSYTIKFKSDLKEACEFRNFSIDEQDKLELKEKIALYNFNISVGNLEQFDIPPIFINGYLNDRRLFAFKSKYINKDPDGY